MSREIPLNNHFLCVSLNLSLPATFHVKVDLVTNSSLTTVYNVDNVGEMVETDMLTVFEVEVNEEETVCQLMVEVSEGTIIRNVNIQNDNCHTSGRFVCLPTVALIGAIAIIYVFAVIYFDIVLYVYMSKSWNNNEKTLYMHNINYRSKYSVVDLHALQFEMLV